ncbi:unnamed protein product [Phytophthora fragariaefolia]|uniref:Unnamed protein product n=1 Tax=Phytophthora fragariaefolia TaxID=1490495 RepID=A0A9W7D7W4_9STRA|nr:unnamed protein product [Phytophthora fragariaefolia]
MAHLAAVPDTIDDEGTATLFLDRVFRQHGMSKAVVSDRDAETTNTCCMRHMLYTPFHGPVLDVHLRGAWHSLGHLHRGPSDPPQTDGQTERVNRVVEDVLRSICAETPERWSAMIPLVEFALNNAVHASTGYTPFYVNGLSHPRVPLTPPRPGSGLSGGEEFAERLADISPLVVRKQVDTFLSTRLSVLRRVRNAMTESQGKQKEHADAKGRSNVNCYEVGDLVLLIAKNNVIFLRRCDLGSRASPTHLEAEPSSQRAVPRGQSQDSDRAEPLTGEPAGQSDRGTQPAFAASPYHDEQSPANTALKSGHPVIKTTDVIPQFARNLDPVQPLMQRINIIPAAIDAVVNVLDKQPQLTQALRELRHRARPRERTLRQHDGRLRRCSTSRGIATSPWNVFYRNVGVVAITSTW